MDASTSCALTRSRSPARRTVPSTRLRTPSSRAISGGVSLRCRSAKTEERAATRSSFTLERASINSSVMPSLKYSSLAVPLTLTNGMTAMDRPSGAFTGAACFVRARYPASAVTSITRTTAPARTYGSRCRERPGATTSGMFPPSTSTISDADWGRAPGSFSRHRITSSAVAVGTAAFRRVIDSGASVRWAANSACGVRLTNGGAPVSSSYASTPNA